MICRLLFSTTPLLSTTTQHTTTYTEHLPRPPSANILKNEEPQTLSPPTQNNSLPPIMFLPTNQSSCRDRQSFFDLTLALAVCNATSNIAFNVVSRNSAGILTNSKPIASSSFTMPVSASGAANTQ